MNESDEGSLRRLRERYRHFAEHEAKEVSPLYEKLALTVAAAEPLLRFVASLPEAKQQPNLLFAAVRQLYGTPADGREFSRRVESNVEPIRDLILQRSTQTNEPARCATLLPALGLLPQPLALLEVGASAGLCLLPDRYGYDYGEVQLAPVRRATPATPVFPCRASETTPIPPVLPDVVWRAGIDLNPIDLNDPEEVRWLETLVWPGQDARAERLRQAIEVAREFPPRIIRGDLLEKLPALAAEAPTDATLVVFHSAVLFYVAAADRERFVHAVGELGCSWISNESPGVFPQIAAKAGAAVRPDRFLLALDGEPLALTGPHGQSIDWLR